MCAEKGGRGMNRAQRRKQIRSLNEFQPPKIPMPRVMPPKVAQNAKPDFSGVPLTTICQSIILLIDELRNRGYPVYDFDHKEKSVQGMQMIRDRIFFLMAEEAADEKEGKSGREN